MIKLTVLEFDYHAEVLRNTCRIIEGSRIALTVFTTTKIWQQVNLYNDELPNNFQLFILDKKNQSLGSFMKAHLFDLNSSDVIFFNTIASNYKLFNELNLEPLQVVRIHNSNAYFKPFLSGYKPRLNLFFLWKDFSHFVRNSIAHLDWYHRNRFLNKVDYFSFSNEIIKKYAIDKLGVEFQKAICLPFTYTSRMVSKVAAKADNNEITISVIGRVDKRSRDYKFLFKSFVEVAEKLKNSDYSINLVLLGAANSVYGRSIVKLFDSISSEKLSVLTFLKFVEQEKFVKIINKTDFLILPIVSKTRYTIYDETFGFTKISGNINDIITYCKPALIKADYPIAKNLILMTDSYVTEAELASKILDWCEKMPYKKFNIDEALKNYQLQEVQESYKGALREILKK